MYQGEGAVKDILHEIKKSALVRHNDAKMQEIIKLETPMLQQWVRQSCMSDSSATDRYKLFVATIVKPSLGVCVSSIPKNLEDIVGRFTAIMKGGMASEEDLVRLRIACSAIKGELTSHPLVCGLALQCSRMINKQDRNIWTMCGRRNKRTERESSLISDAGQQLAMACCNTNLAREFGLSSAALKISLEELRSHSLPTPSLAIRWPGVMLENFELLDQRFVRPHGAPKRDLD